MSERMPSMRIPLALAVSFAALLIAYLALAAPVDRRAETPVLFRVDPGERLERYVVERGSEKVLEIARRSGGPEIVHPFQAPAEPLIFDGVLQILGRLGRDASIPLEGRTLKEFGLDAPGPTVRAETNAKSIALRFGKAGPVERGGREFRYFMVEGDATRVHELFRPQYEELVREPSAWRSRHLSPLEPSRAESLTVQFRPVPAEPALERIELVKSEEEGLRWSMTHPYGARADWSRVQRLLSQLNQLRIGDRHPLTTENLRAFGLEPPPYRLSIGVRGETRPIRLVIARRPDPDEEALGIYRAFPESEGWGPRRYEELKAKERTDPEEVRFFESFERWMRGREVEAERRAPGPAAAPPKAFAAVHVEGTDEIAICDGTGLMGVLPDDAAFFRPNEFVPFHLTEIEEVEVYCGGLRDALLSIKGSAHPKPSKPDEAPPTLRNWTVELPAGAQLPREDADWADQMRQIEAFVTEALKGRVRRFIAPEFTPEPAQLQRPECRLTFKARSGDEIRMIRFYFETRSPGDTIGIADLGGGRFELFSVDPGYVWLLKKRHLNFIPKQALRIDPATFTGLKVRIHPVIGGLADEFRLGKNDAGRWVSDREGKERFREEYLLLLLMRLGDLKVEEYFSQDPGDLSTYGLDRPWIELEIEYLERGRSVQKRMSISPRIGQNLYFATLEGDSLIFQVSPAIPGGVLDLHLRPYEGFDPRRPR